MDETDLRRIRDWIEVRVRRMGEYVKKRVNSQSLWATQDETQDLEANGGDQEEVARYWPWIKVCSKIVGFMFFVAWWCVTQIYREGGEAGHHRSANILLGWLVGVFGWSFLGLLVGFITEWGFLALLGFAVEAFQLTVELSFRLD